MVMVNFLTIDHGVNSRVSWSWSVPYPPLNYVRTGGGGGGPGGLQPEKKPKTTANFKFGTVFFRFSGLRPPPPPLRKNSTVKIFQVKRGIIRSKSW